MVAISSEDRYLKFSKYFLEIKRQCLDLEEEIFTVLFEGLRESHESGKLDRDEYPRRKSYPRR